MQCNNVYGRVPNDGEFTQEAISRFQGEFGAETVKLLAQLATSDS